MDLPGRDGTSLRKHLEQVLKHTKKRPAELVEPVVPRQAAHIWGWFWDLDPSRDAGNGAISFAEIAAWRDLTGEIIRPWEVRALKVMDAERRAATAEAMKI